MQNLEFVNLKCVTCTQPIPLLLTDTDKRVTYSWSIENIFLLYPQVEELLKHLRLR